MSKPMTDDELEQRAAFYRVATASAAFVTAIEALTGPARSRIGADPELVDALSRMAGTALWRSTADFNQAGRDQDAAAVIARAAELAEQEERR